MVLTVKQKNMMPLDRCPRDGGLRYLIVRERKKSLDIMVKCIIGVQVKVQTYKTVAKVRRSALNPHEKGNTGLRDGGYADLIPLETQKEILALVTKRKSGDKKA